ncbi:hypothetical protein FACS1894137_18800 [Spirochaetia bacterium]|nr:hypothetical protein FACS1894137_18800 [Spirochaetia bacterium]
MGKIKADSIRRILLIINLLKEHSQDWGKRIEAELHSRDIQTHSFFFDGQGDFKADGEYDCCFSLGGDGTVLYAARTLAPLGVPIFPVNLGSLGFIAAVHPEEWVQVFDAWLRGEVVLSRRLMLDIRVERQNKTIKRESCLNDAVISALGIARLIGLGVESMSEGGAVLYVRIEFAWGITAPTGLSWQPPRVPPPTRWPPGDRFWTRNWRR